MTPTMGAHGMTEPSTHDMILFAPTPKPPVTHEPPRTVPPNLFGSDSKPKRKRTARTRSNTTSASVALQAPRRSPPSAAVAPQSPPEIKPIETRYAGCRFRSRLEARWAVFFDHLGIEWEYETETYLVGPFGSRRGYLPDFYLPEQDLWIEVKGDPAGMDYDLLIGAANPITGLSARLDPSAPCFGWGLQKLRLLILGPVPAAPGGMHKGLAVLGGELVAAQYSMPYCDWLGGKHGRCVHGFTCIGPACSLPPHDPPRTIGPTVNLLDTSPTAFLPCEHACDAYTAARSARFEHGESG
jgi:hypothetical protein